MWSIALVSCPETAQECLPISEWEWIAAVVRTISMAHHQTGNTDSSCALAKSRLRIRPDLFYQGSFNFLNTVRYRKWISKPGIIETWKDRYVYPKGWEYKFCIYPRIIFLDLYKTRKEDKISTYFRCLIFILLNKNVKVLKILGLGSM